MIQIYKCKHGSSFLYKGGTIAIFQGLGNSFKERLNNKHKGVKTEKIVVFILWLISTGPNVLLTGWIEVVSIKYCVVILTQSKTY